MKRLLSLGALLALAAASFVFAQSSGTGTLRTATGDHRFTFVQQAEHTYLSAAEVVSALGGTIAPDSNGYKITLNGVVAAVGPDSQYAVVGDDLIEMPVPPISIEGNPFVPWQFFQGFLQRAISQDAAWDNATQQLVLRPMQRDAVSVQPSVANVQGITKIVLTLSAPAEYTILKEQLAYVVRFKSPVRAPFAEEAYEDPNIARLTFVGNDLRIQLVAADVVGDAYELDMPPRIVLDVRKGTAAPGTPTPGTGTQPQHSPGIRTIVIDPGHGGKEVGAVGPDGMLEKDITLQLCQKLAAKLAEKTGARVVLTREDDSVVSLDQRTSIANQYNADLFLSVHMNAAVVKDAKGSETYFLSLEASDELARKAADLENAATGGSSRDADLKLILWDLAQQTYMGESSRFAQTIQEEMNAATGVANRGVKQAPFKVLVGATMPAALVEVGFITNPEEEAKLKSAEFQGTMIEALTRAVLRYKSDYETRIGITPRPQPTVPAATGTAPPPARPTTATTATTGAGAQ